jgi:hypothetical protein
MLLEFGGSTQSKAGCRRKQSIQRIAACLCASTSSVCEPADLDFTTTNTKDALGAIRKQMSQELRDYTEWFLYILWCMLILFPLHEYLVSVSFFFLLFLLYNKSNYNFFNF